MTTYEIYKAEEVTTPTGKSLKRLVLQEPGKQYPIKNVTMWHDHPSFQSAVPGGQITCDLIESDSGKPNPNRPGHNYVNRTVANPNSTPQQTQTPLPGGNQNLSEMAIKSHIDSKFAALKYDLKIIADHLGVEAPKEERVLPGTGVEYPESNTYDSTQPAGEEVINPEDIPF